MKQVRQEINVNNSTDTSCWESQISECTHASDTTMTPYDVNAFPDSPTDEILFQSKNNVSRNILPMLKLKNICNTFLGFSIFDYHTFAKQLESSTD